MCAPACGRVYKTGPLGKEACCNHQAILHNLYPPPHTHTHTQLISFSGSLKMQTPLKEPFKEPGFKGLLQKVHAHKQKHSLSHMLLSRVTCGKPFVTNFLFIKTGRIDEELCSDGGQGAGGLVGGGCKDGWIERGKMLQQ